MSDESLRTKLVDVAVDDEGPLAVLKRCVDQSCEEGRHVLRCGLVAINGCRVTLEVSTADAPIRAGAGRYTSVAFAQTLNVALVIPTGIGASIGGFIGDATPVARAFEAVADRTILHPNVVNGAELYGAGDRSLYVDGYTLDEFFAGRTLLGPSSPKRVGLIIDRMAPKQKALTLNAANACCAVWGINLVGYAECREATRNTVEKTRIHHFIGTLHNPTVLYEAANRLIAVGAEAIAVVTAIEGIPQSCWHEHYHSSATNPVGAIEALISRAITWKTGLPCAHAPAYVDEIAMADDVIDPRASAEVIAKTGLPCVLRGLANAAAGGTTNGIAVNDLAAIVVPFEGAGGFPALAAQTFDIPLVAVKANRCVVGASADKLHLKNLIIVENYPEAIGYVVARRAGVSWPALNGCVEKLKEI